MLLAKLKLLLLICVRSRVCAYRMALDRVFSPWLKALFVS